MLSTPTMAEEILELQLFKGRHFDQEIVVLCVRWYLSYKGSGPHPCRNLL
jgi:hypothetical protein